MKRYTFLLLLIFPILSFAECEKAALRYGNGEGVDDIPSGCKILAEKHALPHAKKQYEKSQRTIIGFKNLLYVNDQIFAGEYTRLQDIVAVAFDEKKHEIAVLEKSGDVLIFNGKIPGNVAPVRVIRHKEIHGAVDVAFYPHDEIAVFLGEKKEILTFSRLANYFGREGYKNLGIRRQILNAPGLTEQ